MIPARKLFGMVVGIHYVLRTQSENIYYTSRLWRDKNGYNLPGCMTGYDSQETKLPTYRKTLCLAKSLYSLIADGQHRNTSLGRNGWKRLIDSEASLQLKCNKEGFNHKSWLSRVRLGILDECNSCDSRIGFDTDGYPDDTNTCGNVARHKADNNDKNIKTMGYILNSRRRLFSVDEFQYLNVPHIELIMVYDDFECIFKCLYHPSCISVNLAAKGKLWCELLSSDKYSKPMEYKQNKSSHHYFIRVRNCLYGQCRSLVFKPAKAFDGQRLKNHVIRVEDVSERDFCGILCYMEPYCVSYNLGKQPRADDGKYTCELNNATHEGNKDDLVEDQSYIFGGAEASYRCMCPVGYKGLTCDEDIDECATREHSCSADGVCSNVKGSYKCGCKPGYSGDGRTCK
ncbi:hypothetical protein pdam_00018071, partial [Pocillopora damicornis]